MIRSSAARLAMAGIVCVVSALPSSNAQQVAAVSSALTGIVVDSLSEPVPYAQIWLADGRSGVTAGEDGRFRLGGLSAGKLLVEVRRIGFDPVYFDVEIPQAMIVEVRVRMHRNVRELSTIDITESDPLRKVGFYERMAAGNGHFLPPEVLSRMRPLRATDAFMSIPNLVVDRRGNRSRIVSSNMRCEYAIVIDRMPMGQAGSRVRTTSPDDLVSASDLYAIEVYPGNRGVPLQFLGLSHEDGCGTVVIWTKGMIPR